MPCPIVLSYTTSNLNECSALVTKGGNLQIFYNIYRFNKIGIETFAFFLSIESVQ
jgi:hypothetical protein